MAISFLFRASLYDKLFKGYDSRLPPKHDHGEFTGC